MSDSTEYWNRLTERNPLLRDESRKVQISVSKIKAIAEQAYSHGYRAAGSRMQSDDIFSQIFGGGGKG